MITRFISNAHSKGAARRSADVASIGLQQTTIPDYRQEVVDLLYERWGDALRIYVGEEYFDQTTITRVRLPANTVTARNRFLFGRRLEWQHGIVRKLIRTDIVILEFNPRILSTWIILILRRLMKRHTVLWGHAWSRRGASSATDVVRQVMRRLSSVVLVYSEQQRKELAQRMPNACIVAAPNALYRRDYIGARPADEQPCDVLYVGRMVRSKKPCLLVNAFLMATDAGLPEDIRLVMIGEGPEGAKAQRIADGHGNGDRVSFLGHVPATHVAPYYSRALLSASPGYVGLSLIQSLSFGVPMLIARDEPHAPEIEAVRPGVNSIIVASDAPQAWSEALRAVADARHAWDARRDAIASDCRSRYAVELMVERIVQATKARPSRGR
jgi:glycosyltransferase involved in cell wall biosynthesis